METEHCAHCRGLHAEADDLRARLSKLDLVGQATGILMQQRGVDAAGAAEILNRVSSNANISVYVLAADLVRCGQMAPGSADVC